LLFTISPLARFRQPTQSRTIFRFRTLPRRSCQKNGDAYLDSVRPGTSHGSTGKPHAPAGMSGLHNSGTRLPRAFRAARCPRPASEHSQVGHVTPGGSPEHDLAGFVSGQHLLVTGGAPA
jgi:hypothetical protein